LNNIEYIKHLTTDTDFETQLNAYKGNVSKSKGFLIAMATTLSYLLGEGLSLDLMRRLEKRYF
jgi:hypothetical protein